MIRNKNYIKKIILLSIMNVSTASLRCCEIKNLQNNEQQND